MNSYTLSKRAAIVLRVRIMLSISLCCVFVAGQADGKEPYAGKIGYIHGDAPSIPLTPCRGQSYEDTVPDTYDIQQRAELAINALTGATNPLTDYSLYGQVHFNRNPVIMVQNGGDVWCLPKFAKALSLLRIVTGSKHNDNVDQAWRDLMLRCIGSDGLYYFPLQGRPWGHIDADANAGWAEGVTPVARADGTFAAPHDATVTQVCHPGACGLVMEVMLTSYQRDANPVWREAMEKMIDRFLKLAVHKDDYCYIPRFYFEPNADYDRSGPKAEMPKDELAEELGGRVIRTPAKYYKLTGYKPARELAEKLTRYMRFHSEYFKENGEFVGDMHFHAHTICLIAMLELALATDDKELAEFVRKNYEWAKTPAAGSSTLTGFFPEYARPDFVTCESCEIGDMLRLATMLSNAGVGDYYEEAERWTRNQFAENQLSETEWVNRFSQKQKESPVGAYETADRVLERNGGAFAGWSAANDWLSHARGYGIMHCCTGSCGRAMYHVWRHILDYKDGRLRVNMLLNRASRWADVHSYIPYQGQVDLKMKADCKSVWVHAPEWIKSGSDQIAVTVNGQPREVRWQDRYVDLGEVKAGGTVVVKFPISERTVKETIGTVPYTLVVKGNTVVSIDPPGVNGPLYRRDQYRTEQIRWQKVKRFVPEEEEDKD
jgi:hypothetical protein